MVPPPTFQVFSAAWMEKADFWRDWEDYAHGFGNISGEFWLGECLTGIGGQEGIGALWTHTAPRAQTPHPQAMRPCMA